MCNATSKVAKRVDLNSSHYKKKLTMYGDGC